jgi:hypothetical protein
MAAHRTVLSAWLAITAPLASLATLPVSILKVRPPISRSTN